jgi:hypothetical protein
MEPVYPLSLLPQRLAVDPDTALTLDMRGDRLRRSLGSEFGGVQDHGGIGGHLVGVRDAGKRSRIMSLGQRLPSTNRMMVHTAS